MQKIINKLSKLEKAVTSLEEIYLKENVEHRMHIDATIQRFEFTFELFWKCLKDWFSYNGLDLNFPKEILQEAYKTDFIENEKLWIEMLKDRNLTSRTYDEELADKIFARIKKYTPEIRKAFDIIDAKVKKEFR